MMDYEDPDEEQDGDLGPGPPFPDHSRPAAAAPPPPKLPTPDHHAPPPPHRKSRYKECLKNHAVAIGGHAVDGCGEFIPAGADGSLESLTCAACSCHRNFHRKDTSGDGGGGAGAAFLLTHHHHPHFGYRSPAGYLHVASAAPPRMLALPSSSGGGGGGGSGSREEMEDYYSNPVSSSGKKRFRTKFSQEQKDKMLNFAEGLGWRIQKQDEEMVLNFCNELGIKRHVLKVWMHNNKHTLGKKT